MTRGKTKEAQQNRSLDTDVRHEVLMAINIKSTELQNVPLCYVVVVYQNFGGTCHYLLSRRDSRFL
jgi:hypothetical protein